VFNIHGESETYLFNPTDFRLAKIFEIYTEVYEPERHTDIECSEVIEFWIQELKEKRCEIDYSQNKYHPSLRREERNYIPSSEAILRLKTFYLEKLFLEGIGSFTFDW
jgi:hypothetical protein